jgi:hypothetical protein
MIEEFDPALSSAPLIDVIFFDAGGGHRASATALQAVIQRQERPWRIRLVNLRDILEPIDFVKRVTGLKLENCYNGLLRHGITVGTLPMLRTTQALIRLTHSRQVETLARHWCEEAPALVLSMIPNFNRAMFEGLRAADGERARPATPMATILTDLADYPPHFWIERQEQYLICGTAAAAEQAIAMGHPAHHVFRTSGMIVRPEFYDRRRADKRRERRRLGLDPDITTGIVMFGGYGSRQMLTIARRIKAAGLKTQLIFMCGHNEELREKLLAMRLPYRCRVEGFTRDVAGFMAAADYFIGKPGPGSISEALVMGLPVIVERNAWTMIQERFNTDWIAHNELGVVLQSFFSEIEEGVAAMIDAARLKHFKERVAAHENRAVFEIADLIGMMLTAAPPPSGVEGSYRMNPFRFATA